jgi:hypothetical protein
MAATQGIDPDDIFIESVEVGRPVDGGVNVLRQFHANVEYSGRSQTVAIGQVMGWIGLRIADADIADAADAISQDAAILGAVAAKIIDSRADLWIESALLIDRIHLDPAYRGNRLTSAIIDKLLDLLRLDPESTVTLLYPEPQLPDGGPMPEGRERETAKTRLCIAYREGGLEPWEDTGVWWLPLE